MKLKALFFLMLLTAPFSARAEDSAGIRYIVARGEIRCGTDINSRVYAFRDENKDWRGIDSAWCQVFSNAIFGSPNHFKMVDVQPGAVDKALQSGKIDVMLGNTSLSAAEEYNSPADAAAVLYFDRQMFYGEIPEGTSSMQDFKDSTVCVADKSEDAANLTEYNRKYNLGMRIMTFKTQEDARRAFYLKRCRLISASEIYLRGMGKTLVGGIMKPEVLPEVIAYRPVYAYTAKNNPKLRLTLKWIINALKLAEEKELNAQNADIFIGVSDKSTRNLLGKDEELWTRYGLKPDWVIATVKSLGNFGEMYENNLGSGSEFKIERDKNYLIDRGGLIAPESFL